MKKVTMYTDGACSKNPGPGGWGVVLIYGEKIKKVSGYSSMTTNNIMELTAFIEGMKLLKEKCEVDLYTDSKYLTDSATKWLTGWEKNGWKTSAKKEVKNIPLWKTISEMIRSHKVVFNWVKGHDGNLYNEECDRLAREEILTNQKAE
ncbi:MAG: ribonuclease HI [Candidatus Delongbacteria bacterium]|jgi:ribonuclease HI|nr:ribonuclease HI [Candidatus Delongbacteria bacterium]MDD4204866.1 ribonuclease HI [Candidatus Delongbacteria bacterium]MDY0017133.1 ribonuclease HI [Candidatus Delongbacteria bacterium]